MKLANVSWGWTPIPEDMPEGDSLIKIADQIRGLGFEGVDYLGTPEALDEFFTEEACRTLGEHSRSIGLEPNVFVFQDDSWNACCCEKRENSLKYFEKAAQAAKWIGCRIKESQRGLAADFYPLWCPCLAGRLPGSLIPRLRRSSKAIICRPATAIRRIGKP